MLPVVDGFGNYYIANFQDGLACVCQQVNVEIVKRSDAGRFVVLPKRWIVERTIAWLNRCRRLAKDWERLNRNALALPTLGVHPPDDTKAASRQDTILDRLQNETVVYPKLILQIFLKRFAEIGR